MAMPYPLPDWNQLATLDDARLPLLATALLTMVTAVMLTRFRLARG